jgi:hypothetical protein
MRPLGSVVWPDGGRSAPLKSEQLNFAAMEHGKVATKAFQITLTGDDPAGNCFVCARSPGPVLSDGKYRAQTQAQTLYLIVYSQHFIFFHGGGPSRGSTP